VVDDATGRPVDLAGAAAAGWEAFRAYRDRAGRGAERGGPAEPGDAPDRDGGGFPG
jgi:hypothetical protein